MFFCAFFAMAVISCGVRSGVSSSSLDVSFS